MKKKLVLPAVGAVAYSLCALPAPCHAQDTTSRRINQFISDEGNLLYLGAGVLRPLIGRNPNRTESLRTADALITSVAITEAIKALAKEKRPDTDEHNSFPSGHATAAFAVATMQAHYHPREAPYWYLGATAIAASRVGLHRHYIHDVLVGAGVGYLTARLELSQRRGLVLSPFIQPDTSTKGFSLSLRY